jgi:hypothetical protein
VTFVDTNLLESGTGALKTEDANISVLEHYGVVASTYVKYRTFDGAADWLTLNAAETVGQKMWNPGTAAICLRRSRSDGSGAGGGYQEWFSGVYGAGSPLSVAVYFAPDNRLYSYDPASNGDEGGNSLVVADGWLICAMSRVAASANPRVHSYKFSTGSSSWSHANINNPAPNNSPLDTGSYFEVSQQNGWNQFFAGDIAVLAYWHRALSDAEIETLPASLAAWSALSPNHLWRMENTPVNDTVGTATQRSITGTTVSGSDSPLTLT